MRSKAVFVGGFDRRERQSHQDSRKGYNVPGAISRVHGLTWIKFPFNLRF